MKEIIQKMLIIALSFHLFACDGAKEEEKLEQESEAYANQLSLNVDSIALGDPVRGKKLYLQCRACHSLKKGEPHKIGPNLYSFYNRSAGFKDDFKYSDALSNSGIVWDYQYLDLWLENPQSLIPENKMVYVGMRKKRDREDLIAYLLIETQK